MQQKSCLEALPRFVQPMLASAGEPPADDGRWTAEVKWDGMRCQVRIDQLGSVCLRSRPGRDCTDEFEELRAIGDALGGREVLLDGELVCLADDGTPDFHALRARLGTRRARVARAPATLMVFDVLHLDGRNVRGLPYAQRRKLLDELALSGPWWQTPETFLGRAADLAAVTRERGLEGIVVKRLDAPYEAGRRSRAWVKVKHRRTEQLHVTGWRPSTETQPAELLVARGAGDGSVTFAGTVAIGVGRDANLLDVLRDRSVAIRGRRVRRVEPGLRVEVSCHGRRDGPVRDAVFRGLSEDRTVTG